MGFQPSGDAWPGGDRVVEFVALDPLADATDAAIAERAAAVSARGGIAVGIAGRALQPAHDPLLAALTVTLQEADSDAPTRREVVHVADVDAAQATVRRTVARAPGAAATLAGLLHITERVPVEQGLVAESLAYSTLQAGPEFAAWLRTRPEPGAADASDARIVAERQHDRLVITLARPAKANAYDAAMRDALAEALDVAVLDDSIARVIVRAQGRHFCAGGDLVEFGITPDPATAHLIRTTRSVGRLLDRVRDRTEVALHGACIGAGIELAAFAGHVRVAPDSFFVLPELAMGLVPGAGGTVSLTRRIGRWRVAYLALTGARIDAATALSWGLVDALE